jgi:hypothetical protein
VSDVVGKAMKQRGGLRLIRGSARNVLEPSSDVSALTEVYILRSGISTRSVGFQGEGS